MWKAGEGTETENKDSEKKYGCMAMFFNFFDEFFFASSLLNVKSNARDSGSCSSYPEDCMISVAGSDAKASTDSSLSSNTSSPKSEIPNVDSHKWTLTASPFSRWKAAQEAKKEKAGISKSNKEDLPILSVSTVRPPSSSSKLDNSRVSTDSQETQYTTASSSFGTVQSSPSSLNIIARLMGINEPLSSPTSCSITEEKPRISDVSARLKGSLSPVASMRIPPSKVPTRSIDEQNPGRHCIGLIPMPDPNAEQQERQQSNAASFARTSLETASSEFFLDIIPPTPRKHNEISQPMFNKIVGELSHPSRKVYDYHQSPASSPRSTNSSQKGSPRYSLEAAPWKQSIKLSKQNMNVSGNGYQSSFASVSTREFQCRKKIPKMQKPEKKVLEGNQKGIVYAPTSRPLEEDAFLDEEPHVVALPKALDFKGKKPLISNEIKPSRSLHLDKQQKVGSGGMAKKSRSSGASPERINRSKSSPYPSTFTSDLASQHVFRFVKSMPLKNEMPSRKEKSESPQSTMKSQYSVRSPRSRQMVSKDETDKKVKTSVKSNKQVKDRKPSTWSHKEDVAGKKSKRNEGNANKVTKIEKQRSTTFNQGEDIKKHEICPVTATDARTLTSQINAIGTRIQKVLDDEGEAVEATDQVEENKKQEISITSRNDPNNQSGPDITKEAPEVADAGLVNKDTSNEEEILQIDIQHTDLEATHKRLTRKRDQNDLEDQDEDTSLKVTDENIENVADGEQEKIEKDDQDEKDIFVELNEPIFDNSNVDQDINDSELKNVTVSEKLTDIVSSTFEIDVSLDTATDPDISVVEWLENSFLMQDQKQEEAFDIDRCYVRDILLLAGFLAEDGELTYLEGQIKMLDPEIFYLLENQYSCLSGWSDNERHAIFDVVNEILCEKMRRHEQKKWSPYTEGITHTLPCGSFLLEEVCNEIKLLAPEEYSEYTPESSRNSMAVARMLKVDFEETLHIHKIMNLRKMPCDPRSVILHVGHSIGNSLLQDLVTQFLLEMMEGLKEKH